MTENWSAHWFVMLFVLYCFWHFAKCFPVNYPLRKAGRQEDKCSWRSVRKAPQGSTEPESHGTVSSATTGLKTNQPNAGAKPRWVSVSFSSLCGELGFSWSCLHSAGFTSKMQGQVLVSPHILHPPWSDSSEIMLCLWQETGRAQCTDTFKPALCQYHWHPLFTPNIISTGQGREGGERGKKKYFLDTNLISQIRVYDF